MAANSKTVKLPAKKPISPAKPHTDNPATQAKLPPEKDYSRPAGDGTGVVRKNA